MSTTSLQNAVNDPAEIAQSGQSGPAAITQVTSTLTVLDSVRLFNGQRELIIQHQGEQYRLRITRQEKLILTK